MALGRLGPAAKDAAPRLAQLLSDPERGVRRAASDALVSLGPAAKDAAPELAKLLEHPTAGVREAAAKALGRLGPAAKDVAPRLAQLLSDPEVDVREAAAKALGDVAEGISDRNERDASAINLLEISLKYFEIYDSNNKLHYYMFESKRRIKRAVDHLKALERASLTDRVWSLLQAVSIKDWKTWAVIIPLTWSVIIFAIFLAKPLWLLRWNEALKDQLSVKIKPGEYELSLGIPLGYVTLVRLLAYRPRVLDAWVKAHIDKARGNFDELPTVKGRMVHVPSPVKVDGQLVAELSAATLRAHASRAGHQCRWLIFGEGGVGKTSLACQIAHWAMAHDKAYRLALHLMLPVLIEDELDDPATPPGLQRFTEAVRGKLQALIGSAEPISPELLKHLLRRWRVVVVIDHLTEMSQVTRDQIRFGAAEFPVAALVVSARTDPLGNLPKHTVEPMRIEGNRLSVFLYAYLNERKQRELFDDPEYFEACSQLSRMVGERDITVLLAKLYADQMVAAKGSPDGDGLPKTIPDLMLRYLNELNRNTGGQNNRTVQRDCKAIAWECLKASYRPGAAERVAVLELLKGNGRDERSTEDRLDYLINRLRVIQVTGAAENRIRFVLDPLAEYLAGLQVVEENQGRGTKQKWERFLREADRMEGAPDAIRGFLLAVRDCCLASTGEVPAFVPDELGRRGNLDPELMHRLHLIKRVRLYINNLNLPHAEDRSYAGSSGFRCRHLGICGPAYWERAVFPGVRTYPRKNRYAAQMLGRIGAEARDASPRLVELLSDPDADVRRSAADALAQIGPAAKKVVPPLVKLLEHPTPDVRSSAAGVLGQFGAEARDASPRLVELVSDPDADVRRSATNALGQIGPAAKKVVPPLVKLLEHPTPDVRSSAAGVLGQFGAEARDASPRLVELVSDPDVGVRRSAAVALGQIGLAARDAVPQLAEFLSDPDAGVRRSAAVALGRFGPEAKDTAPELAELVSDPDADVRRSAANALGQIRPAAKKVVPQLVKLLEHPTPDVRSSAAGVLGQFGPEARDAAPQLVKLLEHPDADVRRSAADALAQIGPAAKKVVPPLVKLLEHPTPDVRSSAALALRRFGPEAKDTAPELAKLLSDPDADVRRSAIFVLGRFGLGARDTAPEVAKLLSDPDADVREAAADALCQFGREAKDAAPQMVKLLQHPTVGVRRSAALALRRCEPEARDVVPELAKLLEHPTPDMRWSAAVALGRFGPEAKDTAPELAKLLSDLDAGVRQVAAVALGEFGPEARDTAPELAKLLSDPDADVRWSAAFALGRFGPGVKDAAPELARLLSDPDADVRWSAAVALGQIGLAAKDAALQLAELLSDPDADVQEAAAFALGRFGPGVKDATPELAKLLSDPDAAVREAAEALHKPGKAIKEVV